MNVATQEPKKKVEVGIFVLADQHKSPYIKEGTENTAHPEHLSAPRLLRVPNTGKRIIPHEEAGYIDVPIRYIHNETEIDLAEQKKKGYPDVMAHNSMDDIYFENGTLVVANDGSTRTLFRYLTENIENRDAPNRPGNLPAPLYYRHNEEKNSERILDKYDTINKVRS